MYQLKNIIQDFHQSCTDCGLCTDFCSHFKAIDEKPKSHTEKMLRDFSIEALSESSSHCNECGRCELTCPKSLNYRLIHQTARRKAYPLKVGVPSKMARLTVDFHQKGHFHPLLNHKTKGFKNDIKRKVFFPGCALIQQSPDIVNKVYDFLKNTDDNIGLMSNCCGKPTLSIGDEQGHSKRMQPIVKQVKTLGIEEIIVACPNCFKTLSSILPDVQITFITSALVRYNYPIKENGSPITVSIHDPCPIRYETNVHDDVREIITSSGFNIREREYIGKNTLCCGSGGMLKVLQPNTNQLYMDDFMESFYDDLPVITYCMECKEAIISKGKKCYHLLEILFADNCNLIPNLNSFQRWKNRYYYIKEQSKRQA